MSDSDEEWERDEYEEEEDEDQKCPCLFCIEVHKSGEDVLEHCRVKHSFSLMKFKRLLKLDYYECIKLINYIRKEHPSVAGIMTISTPPFPWSDDVYLKPVFPDDPLLQIDYEDEEDVENTKIQNHIFDDNNISNENEQIISDLRRRLHDSQITLKKTEEQLAQSLSDIQCMRQTMNGIFSEDRSRVEDKKSEEDDEYFSSYSHFGIHAEMLKDQVRMESYQVFIYRNPELFKDKVVLDVGCGTGILSMFAIKSGARHVIAVDQSDIIHKAMEIARENDVHDRITFIHGCIEEVVLPVEHVDIVISEWMGYCLLFESMLDSVLFARDKWLEDSRQIYPNHCSLSLVAMGDEYAYQCHVGIWDDVGGFKMTCMKEDVLREAVIMTVDQYSLISSDDVIKKFDLTKVKPAELEFESRFSLTMQHNTQCHALVAYFDIGFEVPTYRVYFSTSPQDTPTHWKQTVFFFQEPVKVLTGDLMRGSFSCTRNSSDHRCLNIKLKAEILSFHEPNNGPVKIEQSFSLS